MRSAVLTPLILAAVFLLTGDVQGQQTCTDSDNSNPQTLGADRLSRGRTVGYMKIGASRTNSIIQRDDFCTRDGTQLVEHFCQGDQSVGARFYNCPEGERCGEGVCYHPLNLGEGCENHQECLSGYCGGEQYCYGGQGAPRVCYNICSRKPAGETCTQDDDCLSGNCASSLMDPSYGGLRSCRTDPDCNHPQGDCVGAIPGGGLAPEGVPGECYISLCEPSREELPLHSGERCSGLFGNMGAPQCGGDLTCRPTIHRTRRVFYNLTRKTCMGKVRAGDPCWFNEHCQSNTCRDGRCQ